MGRSLYVACLLAALCSASHAVCETGLAERMHEKLHPRRTLDHERAVCEPWRGTPGRYVVVLPLPRAGSEPEQMQFDLDVLVVQQADNGNTEHARIVSRVFEENALSEDAVRIAEIRLDTARWMLAPDVRAFGLRILRQGASRTAPYSNETLSLFVPQGPRLAEVLDNLEVSKESGESDGDCAANFETLRGNVSPARSTTSGYADLILRQSRSDSRSIRQGEECVTQEQPGSYKSHVLRFDGKEYKKTKAAVSD